MRHYQIPPEIVEEAKALGITEAHLRYMVERSARFTHMHGNRRHHGYLFRVEGDRVTFFGRLDELGEHQCSTCKDIGRVPTFDACAACGGAGCEKCDQGLVPSSFPCPDCELGKVRGKQKV